MKVNLQKKKLFNNNYAKDFCIKSDFEPAGDQPQAAKRRTDGINRA